MITPEIPTIVVKRNTTSLGPSVVNWFALAAGYALVSFPLMGWFHMSSPVPSVLLIFAGLILYILGIYDWYKGKTAVMMINFVTGLVFLRIPLTSLYSLATGIPPENEVRSKIEGTFYIFIFVLLLVLVYAVFHGSYIYLITIFLWAVGYLLLLMWEYSDGYRIRKAAGYFFFFNAIVDWIIGTCHLMNSTSLQPIIGLTIPEL